VWADKRDEDGVQFEEIARRGRTALRELDELLRAALALLHTADEMIDPHAEGEHWYGAFSEYEESYRAGMTASIEWPNLGIVADELRAVVSRLEGP
jgi:hypothetical protein